MASGIAAMMNPREIVIPHHATRYFGNGTVEVVSKEGCLVYGGLSICMGVAALWSATVRGPDVPRSDRSIAQSILVVRRALDERYGVMEGCTVPQIQRTAKDLRVARKFFPYLCAAFLGRSELDSLRIGMPKVRWDEVANRIERIAYELAYGDLNGAHFHESWRAGNDL